MAEQEKNTKTERKNYSSGSARRKGRETALFGLFAFEMSGNIDKSEVFDNIRYLIENDPADFAGWKEESFVFGKRVFDSVLDNLVKIDGLITEVSENWNFKRVTAVDRNILRIGTAEIVLFDDIPDKVAINEAIELAKLYSTEKSGTFVNGILDPIAFKKKEKSGNGKN
ncbi:MAG: transcription antitermination factor NusB [Fibrobacterota bacterium]